MSERNLLDELKRSKGYDIALFTTFNFEISFFEDYVKNLLFAYGVRKISLFVDSKELNKAIHQEGSAKHIGSHYVVNPIEIRGSFHPKVWLFIGRTTAKLIVGSANLTSSGLCVNNEIFNVFELSNKDYQNKSLIISAIDFFKRLNEMSFGADNDLMNEVDQYRQTYLQYPDADKKRYFLSNLDIPMMESISSLTNTQVKRINVAVPFYDNNGTAAKRLYEEMKAESMILYLQNRMCRINLESFPENGHFSQVYYSGFNDRSNKKFYHGKVFRFEGEQIFVLYGSANCTESALCKTHKNGGNIETCILEIDDSGESELFLSNFRQCSEDEDISFDCLKYSSEDYSNFFFRYGAYDGEKIIMHLGYLQRKDDLQISDGNKDLEYRYVNDDIEVMLQEGDYAQRNLTILLRYSDTSETIHCWYTNPIALLFHRRDELKEDPIENVNYTSEESRFVDDQITIMQALATNLDKYKEEYHKKRQYQMNAAEREDDEDDIPDDGIVSYVIPQQDIDYEIRRQRKILEIKEHFFHSFFSWSYSKGDSKTVRSASEAKVKPRKATDKEKGFRRFVFRQLRGFVNPDFVNEVDFDHYLKCSTVFLNVFEKYTLREPVQGLFDDIETARYRVILMQNLLQLSEFDHKKYSKELKEMAIRIVLENAFFCNLVEDRTRLERDERDLLWKLDSRGRIRSWADQEVRRLVESYLDIPIIKACDYLDGLFGFLPINRLNEIFFREFPGATLMGERGKIPTITIETDSMKPYMKVNSRTIKELIKYNKRYRRWEGILLRIVLKKSSPDMNNPNPLVKLEYSFVFRSPQSYGIVREFECFKIFYSKKGDTSRETYNPNELDY